MVTTDRWLHSTSLNFSPTLHIGRILFCFGSRCLYMMSHTKSGLIHRRRNGNIFSRSLFTPERQSLQGTTASRRPWFHSAPCGFIRWTLSGRSFPRWICRSGRVFGVQGRKKSANDPVCLLSRTPNTEHRTPNLRLWLRPRRAASSVSAVVIPG